VNFTYIVYCLSRIQLRMSLAMYVRCVTYNVRLAMDHVEKYALPMQVCREVL